MLYVFLSICCSVMICVMFKLAKRYHIDVLQAITWNFTAAMLALAGVYKPVIDMQTITSISIYPYIALGILLPLLLLSAASSVRINGIVITTIVERLAIFIPLVISFLLYNEALNNLEITAIGLCFLAILCIIPWKRTPKRFSFGWMYLLGLFIGIGIALTLFRSIANGSIPNITSFFILFSISFIVSAILLIIQIVRKKTHFSLPHVAIGWMMGLAFIGYAIFTLKFHQVMGNQPRVSFSAQNVGIITLAMMVGLFIFNERLTYLNKAGIFLALVAIIVIANTDLINAF